jgi:hypothetical protein
MNPEIFRDPTKPVSRAGDLESVAWCIRRLRTAYAWFTGVSIAASAVVAVLWLVGLDVMWVYVVGGLAALFTAVGAWTVPGWWRVETSNLYLTLRERPSEVLWIFPGTLTYRINGVSMPHPDRRIHLCCVGNLEIPHIVGVA